MTKLHEYHSKDLIKKEKIPVPQGCVVTTPEQAEEVTRRMNRQVVVKAQAWVTGRAGMGAIKFADTPEEAKEFTREMLGMTLKGVPVERVLIEESLEIEEEFYAGVIIDDTLRKPVFIFSSTGGSGIEDLAGQKPGTFVQFPVDIGVGLKDYQVRNIIRKQGIHSKNLVPLSNVMVRLFLVAKKYEARSAEINPIGLTKEGKIVALDCRIVVDDNAVFRHPELGIEVAREFDRPPTELEKVAYKVEERDYRGTFYFLQLETNLQGEGYVGFHGGGGGGSMMAMDALMRHGFKLPNFCDTSGNPPASKVYRAAKIILKQKNLEGYFHSGSGVASQEQFQTARGLVKAFREINLAIPAVIRIGGNSEEEAMRILHEYTRDLPGVVEAYGRDTDVDYCAKRLKELITEHKSNAGRM